MCSERGAPPGSRVVIASTPYVLSFSVSALQRVDFPDPSPPSSVMNIPRFGVLVSGILILWALGVFVWSRRQ